ncbi:hypothetical protein Salat_1322100 [Sesamum alatum]|uniref:Uncharacterized protein n=1 Tax=Sesamum alatum TaxID=300844 RepID=A0AAE1YHA8_9LAMI|nr:hypothetical protein Salat_1322100 [Sesamum alatum]
MKDGLIFYANESSRYHGTLHKDEATNQTYCIYNSYVATGYGVGAFLFLLSSESLLMGVTKCMCFGIPLAPGGNRAWTIIHFVSSWMTFLVAEACLIAGARKNAYHTKYRNMIYADDFSCESLQKGIFIAGAVFVVATMIRTFTTTCTSLELLLGQLRKPIVLVQQSV